MLFFSVRLIFGVRHIPYLILIKIIKHRIGEFYSHKLLLEFGFVSYQSLVFFFLFILEMSEVINKISANKVLEDLIKTSIDCAQCIDKNEDLSEMVVNGLKEELEKANEKVNTNGNKVYVFQDQSEHEIPDELVLKYPESLFYYNLIDLDSRMEKRIEADIKLKYFDDILKYMKNEFDIKKLISIQFEEFCRELVMLHIPFRDDIIERFISIQ